MIKKMISGDFENNKSNFIHFKITLDKNDFKSLFLNYI